ncbi:MAG: hypothetical protein WC659_05270 [Patescibacteria group bacterium]
MVIDVMVQVNYWRKNAAAKWKTAQGLYSLKRYADCLFFLSSGVGVPAQGIGVSSD